jgi:hypothetical protein
MGNQVSRPLASVPFTGSKKPRQLSPARLLQI